MGDRIKVFDLTKRVSLITSVTVIASWHKQPRYISEWGIRLRSCYSPLNL